MRGFYCRPLRVTSRLFWLAAEMILAALDYFTRGAPHNSSPQLAVRTHWLQRACRRVLRVFNVEVHVTGPIPSTGLLVCNHLSYLDILVICATTPCLFVAKSEVRRWPVFGWFARHAGTVFVRRDSRSDVRHATRKIREALDRSALVVLFPEGTTSEGTEILPFKSALLEAAVVPCPITAGFIHYSLCDGDVSKEVCYWKDMTFVPHLVNLLSKRSIQAALSFARSSGDYRDRKELAARLHAEVQSLKSRESAPQRQFVQEWRTHQELNLKPSDP